MAKYEIRFVYNPYEKSNRDITLIFGETDAVTVARRCFAMGRSGRFDHIEITKVDGRHELKQY